MRIKDLSKIDRPREKLKIKGPTHLSDFELLMAIFGSGNKQADVTKIAHDVLSLIKKKGINLAFSQLEQTKGLGSTKISELLAAVKLCSRHLVKPEQPIINSAEDAVSQLNDIRDKRQEYFVCLTLDGANRVIAKRTITIGTLNSSLSHPREVFADAVAERAANIIIAHNHPSGVLKPSENDIEITKKLLQSGKILGIQLLDHIILTSKSFYSFAEEGLIM
ncbi:hypothetical protein B6D29_01455 [Microgenomates bacterium UTCPR1]|nr:MAG: hypothetical protein B6D29_01455 [Microgenomates bacterium UTCPR1]